MIINPDNSVGIGQVCTAPVEPIDVLWEAGQRYMVSGQYMLARRLLERAEAQAWRRRDGTTLARIYLPLLEASRLLRQQACDGAIYIHTPAQETSRQHVLREFIRQPAGCLLLGARAGNPATEKLLAQAQYAARKTGRALEVWGLLQKNNQWRLAAMADARFAAGLPVRWAANPADAGRSAATGDHTLALPRPGLYPAGSAAARFAGETLLTAGELLALKWQARHRVQPDRWAEMAWLRQARQIDPACEPVLMRLIALAMAG